VESPAPARGAASATRPATRGRGDNPAARTAKPARPPGVADGPPPDEPPFDPDYDGVPKAAYEGFDPGDEPMDDESTVRETSEEQAIRVLTETFGAEKIGEAKPQR
jgi:DNA polymerase-3 subunit gamma/tau